MIKASGRWTEVALGDICEFKYGKSLPEAARAGGVVPVYGSNGIVGRHDEALTLGPTIIIGRKGSYGEVNYSTVGCWPIDTTYYVDQTATAVHLGWLRHALVGVGLNRMNRAAAVPGLNREDAYRARLVLPSLTEQYRIAEILDLAELLQTKRRQMIANLDRLREAIFLDVFKDALAAATRIPLKALISEFRYGTSEKSGAVGYPALRIPNVLHGSLDLAELKTVPLQPAEFARLRLVDGDMLFVRTNGNPDNVGRCAVFEASKVKHAGFDTSEFVYASYLIRVRLKKGTVLPVVLQQYLSSSEGRRALRARCKTSAGQYNINTAELGSLPVPNFPDRLQHKFVKLMTCMDQLRSTHQALLANSRKLFAALEQRAFQGEL